MINELVQRLRDEMVEQSSRCGEEDSQDRALLAEEAANEIERLLKREKDLMDVIDSRDRALGFVPLDEVHASEPLPCAPRESDWCCTHCGRDNDPSETHCVHCEWSRKHTVTGVLHERGCEDNPCRCGAVKSLGASRDTSPELHAKGCPCPDCLNGTTRSNVEQFASRDASPADLVGALQDVVHTDPGPARAGRVAREWNFERYRSGKLMAQGVKVHAVNYAEAYEKAVKCLFIDGNKPTDELRLANLTATCTHPSPTCDCDREEP